METTTEQARAGNDLGRPLRREMSPEPRPRAPGPRLSQAYPLCVCRESLYVLVVQTSAPPTDISLDPGSRPNISTPYNFQHLTHTHSRQFKSVDKASENELATELSAIQAVQRSQRRLQGIAAHDLSTQSSACPSPLRQAPFSPALTSASSAYSNGERDASELVNSPPPTPPQQDYFNHNHSHFADSPDVPVVPPRKSSRAAARAAACSSQQHAGPLTSYDEGPVRGSIPLDHSKSPYFTAPQTPSETPREIWEHPAVPHAMTTPDNTAYILKSPPHRASLSNVIEEDGHSSPGQGSRPSTPGSGLRHAKSFPNTLSPAWHQEDPHSPILGYHRSFSVDDGLSQNQSLGPTVGQPLDDIPAHPLHHSRLTPASPPAFDGSWEDDIDFCYEHAAEADCDFDWTRPSLDIPEVRDEQGVLSGLRPEALQIRKRPCSSSYQLPRLHTSLSVSRLSITNSANSSIASVAGPATPANPFLISNPGEHRKACVSPTVYGPGCSFPDDTAGLESALRPVSDTEASAYGTKPLYSLHSFRFDPPVASENNSQRSSRSRISKSTSRDSFWSSRASSTSISRRKDNASASSVDSLPDLIYSQATHEQRMAGLKQNRPLLGGMQHARTKSEAILSATPPSSNVGSELLRKRSTSTTAGTMARGSSYRVFPPPTPAIKVVQ